MNSVTKAYLALVYVCIMWGTTYLAIRVAVMHYPPFLFAGVRQAVSGVVLMLLALAANRVVDLSITNLLRQLLVGFLMLTMGNGLVTWGEKVVPSGIAALICSAMPLFAISFSLLSSKAERMNATIAGGLLLGLGGVALIFRQSISDMGNSQYLFGIIGILVATSSWAIGSVVNKKNKTPVNPFFNSGIQLLGGGLCMLLISPVADDFSHFTLWNKDGFLALLYLIVFGSILAYAAYMYCLSHLPVGVATIYAYVNPLVAVLLGYLVLNEEVNIYTALAFVAIITSVYLVNRGYASEHKKVKTVAALVD